MQSEILFRKEFILIWNIIHAIDSRFLNQNFNHAKNIQLLKRIIFDFNKKYKHVYISLKHNPYKISITVLVDDDGVREVKFINDDHLNHTSDSFRKVEHAAMSEFDELIDIMQYMDSLDFNLTSDETEQASGNLKSPMLH